MKLFGLFLLVVSTGLHAADNFGEWGTDCTDEGFLIQLSKEPKPLIVNDNQIVISINSAEKSPDKMDVFFRKTLDLGAGGMNLNWKNVSQDVKIAEINVNGNEANFKWLGFFDSKKHQYFWSSDPDFVQSYAQDGIIKLQKCQ